MILSKKEYIDLLNDLGTPYSERERVPDGSLFGDWLFKHNRESFNLGFDAFNKAVEIAIQENIVPFVKTYCEDHVLKLVQTFELAKNAGVIPREIKKAVEVEGVKLLIRYTGKKFKIEAKNPNDSNRFKKLVLRYVSKTLGDEKNDLSRND